MVRIQLEDRGYLDVKEGTYFPLNFALGDIRDISKRKGTFSKTITLVGNDNNHNLLNHYYDVNIQAGTFDINQLTKCSVIQDGIVILENAYLQLVEVVRSEKDIRHDVSVEYKVLVKDSVSDFFTVLGNKELTDINLAEYNHTYNAANVVTSFGHDITDGYKYVLPLIPTNNYNLTSCHPAVYAKLYFDKIFQGAGYTYEWGNLTPSSGTTSDSNYFEKLLIPYNGGEVKVDKDQTRVEANLAAYTTTHPHTLGYLETFEETLDGWTETQDNDGLFNPTTGIYTLPVNLSAPENVVYDITIDYDVVINNNSGANATLTGTTPGGYPAYYDISPRLKLDVLNNAFFNTYTFPTTTITAGAVYANGSTNIASGTFDTSIFATNIQTSEQLDLKIGSLIEFDATAPSFQNGGGSLVDVDLDIVVNSISIKINLAATNGFGDTVNLNKYVPRKVKQSEFIKSIFLMYNLFAEVDKSNPNKLILKTRDDYYDAGAEVDWTDKLSKDRDQTIKFLPELASKKMLLTYKPDVDDPNKIYTQATNDIYGQLRFTFQNEYIRGEDRKELIFSPTPHTTSSFGAIVPMLSVLPQNNIRILIDGGTDTCNSFNIYNYFDGSSWVGSTGLTSYPVITHFDDPVNPSFDLNFGTCDYYFYNELNSRTNNTLFNNYWRRTLGQIDKGKMLTAYFALTESDIQKHKLNDKIRINNSWWNINKIIDYNANARGFTKVELISVDEESKLTPFAIDSEGGSEEVNLTDFINVRPVKPIKPTKPTLKPTFETFSNDYGNQSNTAMPWQEVKFYGRGNTVDGNVKAGMVFGDDKHLDQDGIIAPYLYGVTQIDLPDGTTWTVDGLVGSPYNVIDAETDAVIDVFSRAVCTFIDGGTDTVIALGSLSEINCVDANTDEV